MSLKDIIATRRIIVCAGPGGVGKTTAAAALAILAARAGRRTLVCTIDPAPRLADALGVSSLTGEPHPLSPGAHAELGIAPPGEFFAAQLDTEAAFFRLVETQVADPDLRRRILNNSIYRQITTTLTGSQEYAATLALYDLHRENKYDLIVLDTPPTANALDFVDAPRRIEEAVTSPAIRWFSRAPGDRTLAGRLRAGGALALQRLGKFVGSQFLDDLGTFLGDFQLVLAGFRERALAVDHLLRDPSVAFLLVLAPDTAAVNEALFFHGRLQSARIALCGFMANRVLHAPKLATPDLLRRHLLPQPQLRDVPGTVIADAVADLAYGTSYLHTAAQSQRRQLARLAQAAPGIPITEIPLLAHDVSTLASLRTIGQHLGL